MNAINFCYLVASVLFILGLKGMTRPKTAVRGNMLGSIGMLIAVVATLFDAGITNWTGIIVGIVIGSAVGVFIAQKVEMTAMPELVALFNGLGGLASFLVAFAALLAPEMETVTEMVGLKGRKVATEVLQALPFETSTLIATAISGLIGAVTFSGSLVAFGKLSEASWVDSLPRLPGGSKANAVVLVVAILLGIWVVSGSSAFAYFLMVLVALLLGVWFGFCQHRRSRYAGRDRSVELLFRARRFRDWVRAQ